MIESVLYPLNEGLGTLALLWHLIMVGPYGTWLGIVLLVLCVLALIGAIDDATTSRRTAPIARTVAAVASMGLMFITIMLLTIVLERVL